MSGLTSNNEIFIFMMFAPTWGFIGALFFALKELIEKEIKKEKQ